jgi:hypothetical protein
MTYLEVIERIRIARDLNDRANKLWREHVPKPYTANDEGYEFTEYNYKVVDPIRFASSLDSDGEVIRLADISDLMAWLDIPRDVSPLNIYFFPEQANICDYVLDIKPVLIEAGERVIQKQEIDIVLEKIALIYRDVRVVIGKKYKVFEGVNVLRIIKSKWSISPANPDYAIQLSKFISPDQLTHKQIWNVYDGRSLDDPTDDENDRRKKFSGNCMF